MSSDNGKICPACKMRNDASSATCSFCGVPFEVVSAGPITTTTKMPSVSVRSTVENVGEIDHNVKEIPSDGIAIYRANFMYPFAVRQDKDFIIGRKADSSPNGLLDLSPLEGYIMGVSKQHVRIQGVENGYQITDLGSTNGTWVNDVRLTANQPAILPNAARVRMGRIELYFIYRLKTS
jgi:pSer/pThr/pTyr-binding forkhead associated (FHA) protein